MRLWPRRVNIERFLEKLSTSRPWDGYDRGNAVRDLRALFSTDLGRRCLWVLLDWTGTHRQSFDPNNPTITAFREGQRSVGLRLIRYLNDNTGDDNG